MSSLHGLYTKVVSDSHSLDIFDEYTRRQYQAKAPHRNPFGDDEEPLRFNEMDIYSRVRVLQQLSTWTFNNPDRMREKMLSKSPDLDHLDWRIEELGWDKDGRAYYVLDDNRLYRRTDEPVPAPTPTPKATTPAKSKSSKATRSKATRASKRRKIEDTEDEEPEEPEADVEAGAPEDTTMTNGDHAQVAEEGGFGFTSKTWENVAITLDDYQEFLASIFRSRDPNEKQLRKRLEEQVMPIIEKREEAMRQKRLKKLRELENVQKMATAKRSGRLADKAEKEKEDRDKREAEDKKLADLRMAHEEEERQKRIEEGHESRRLTREQRLKEREVKRILHEEEMAKAEEEQKRASSQDPNSEGAEAAKRLSERQVLAKKEQHKKELEKLAAEDEGKWYFDCSVCGMHGENLDDGSHSVACDRCSVWQHSKCHGFSPKQAEKDGFTFICRLCKQKQADANKPKIAPLKLGKIHSSSSPPSQKNCSRPSTENGSKDNGLPAHVQRQLDGVYVPHPARPSPGPFGQITNGPSLSPQGQAHGPPGYQYPPVANYAPRPPQQAWHGSPLPPPNRPSSSGYGSSPPPPMSNAYAPSPHQQQHQYAHQTAMASAGGHPPYQGHYPPQPNGYSQRTPNGMYPMTQPAPQQQYYQQPPFHYQQQQAPPAQRPGSGQLMNGFQSPQKQHAKPSASPPQPPREIHQQPQGYHQAPRQTLSQSPQGVFSVPVNAYQRQNAQSPIKSSPPPSQAPYKQYYQPQQPQHLMQTPQNLRPPSANGYQPPLQTQLPTTHAAHGANGIVADGMSGPWPEGSKAIPQKQDPSPATPSSSQTVGETAVMPPVAALTPSPGQQTAAGPQGVPVKKSV